MKIILCCIGVATLFLTNGCVVRTHDRGGYYGPTEYQRGEYHGYRHDRYGYWDHDGSYHSYRYDSFPAGRGQHPDWDSRYYGR